MLRRIVLITLLFSYYVWAALAVWWESIGLALATSIIPLYCVCFWYKAPDLKKLGF